MYIPLKKVPPAAGGNEEADRRHKLEPSCRPIALLLSVTSSSTTPAAAAAQQTQQHQQRPRFAQQTPLQQQLCGRRAPSSTVQILPRGCTKVCSHAICPLAKTTLYPLVGNHTLDVTQTRELEIKSLPACKISLSVSPVGPYFDNISLPRAQLLF